MFGTTMDEVTGDCRRLHSEELHETAQWGAAWDCTVRSCMTCGPHQILLIWSNKPERGGWWRGMCGGVEGCVHQSWERGLKLWSVIVSSGSPFLIRKHVLSSGLSAVYLPGAVFRFHVPCVLLGFLLKPEPWFSPLPIHPVWIIAEGWRKMREAQRNKTPVSVSWGEQSNVWG